MDETVYLNLYTQAFEIAEFAHKGQSDKARMPYILHPVRVAERCRGQLEKITALLHDCIEDTFVTEDYLLKKNFPKEIVDAVRVLTKDRDTDYMDYIKNVKTNPIARVVKIADLEDNLDIKRLNSLTGNDLDRLNKYLLAYKLITNE